MVGLIVVFHCESNPGYAAASHEITFLRMAERLVGSCENIHFSYRSLAGGRSPSLPDELTNIMEFDAASRSQEHLAGIQNYIRRNNIRIAFGFDQPVRRPAYRYMREGGIRRIISYWGAPMSSINHGLKLGLKKMYVALSPNRPDHFVFQSEDMRRTATHGQGIPSSQTSVVRTGIDTNRFSPSTQRDWYAHSQFNIDRHMRIVVFSGHMEGRKGVDVIIRTAIHLIEEMKRTNVHFLILGNRNGQERAFFPLYEGTAAEAHITFGGYRDDVPQILKSCSIGFIASTGWDSFPMSSIEMAATQLPLVISNLPGLREAITSDTGFLYPVGDYVRAADCIARLLDDEELSRRMGIEGRARAIERFSVDRQIADLEAVVRKVAARDLG